MTSKTTVLVVGAGGFGRELYAWASHHPEYQTKWQLAGFLDDNPDALKPFGNFAPVSPIRGHRVNPDYAYLCGIGLPPMKEAIIAPLVAAGARFLTFIHPTAVIGARVELGLGVVICPGVVVSVDIRLGDFVALNPNATVGHDATIGEWSTLSAQCDVTGYTRIADRVFLGSGASVIPSKIVGSGAVIGAGAVVISDIAAGATAVGVPAREI